MANIEIINRNLAKPDTMSDTEYGIIEECFASGMPREQVITKMNYDRNWYYRRLKSDARLKLAETRGHDALVEHIPKDVGVGLKKSLLGHTTTVQKRAYQIIEEIDEDGNVREVRKLVSIIEEDKYTPPSASVVNTAARGVIAGLKEDESAQNEITKAVSELPEEDIKTLAEIAMKNIRDSL